MNEGLERKVFEDTIGDEMEFDNEMAHSLADIVSDFKDLLKDGANHLRFSQERFGEGVKIQAVKISQEPYSDWMERMRKAKEILEIKNKMKAEAAEKAEYTNYLRLKEKFENK